MTTSLDVLKHNEKFREDMSDEELDIYVREHCRIMSECNLLGGD